MSFYFIFNLRIAQDKCNQQDMPLLKKWWSPKLRYCSTFTVASTPYNIQVDLGHWLYTWTEMYVSIQELEVESTGMEKDLPVIYINHKFSGTPQKRAMSEQVYNTAFLFRELICPAFLTTAIKELGILVFAIIILYDFASII